METLQAEEWARQTFAGASLGDPRRTRRLVDIAAAVAKKPSGTVTGALRGSAAKEGAFRWLESDAVCAEAVSEAMFESVALRCDSPTTFVAVDQTDLSFVDRQQVRGLGPVCYRNSAERRAIHVMNSFALDAAGTAVGLLDQQMWLRPEEATPGKRKYRPQGAQQDHRAPEERESWQWVRALKAALARVRPSTQPWFIADRGADFHGFLCELRDGEALFTVRSAYDRAIERNGKRQTLWSTLCRGKIQGRVDAEIPAGPNRRRRRATFELRAIEARVKVRSYPLAETWRTLSCVQVREVKPPVGEKRIEWKLLSNHPLAGPADALAIFRSYTLRWRVEEFHKTWKTGACNVESSQLRSLNALKKWATILAAVAGRIERLKQLSRAQPDLDALQEFSREELDAAITLSEEKFAVGDNLTLQQAVRLVAMVGGYMGRRGDGPPGSITIRRGLEQVLPAARVLAAFRSSG